MILQASGFIVRFGQSSEKFLLRIKQATRAASTMTIENASKRIFRTIERTSNDGCEAKLNKSRKQVFPGIPDDITEFLIIPKLDWKARCVLSWVSHASNRAIQTSIDARIRSLASDTKVVIDNIYGSTRDMRLISMVDGFSYRFPPITYIGPGQGFRPCSVFIFLNGKVYAIGGLNRREGNVRVADVYVLDMFGERRWQQCRSMQHARAWDERSRPWAVRGKICVYGGIKDIGIDVAELYDPDSNTWDQIQLGNGRYLEDVFPEVEEIDAFYNKLGHEYVAFLESEISVM